jgi:hypothetical protein
LTSLLSSFTSHNSEKLLIFFQSLRMYSREWIESRVMWYNHLKRSRFYWPRRRHHSIQSRSNKENALVAISLRRKVQVGNWWMMIDSTHHNPIETSKSFPIQFIRELSLLPDRTISSLTVIR